MNLIEISFTSGLLENQSLIDKERESVSYMRTVRCSIVYTSYHNLILPLSLPHCSSNIIPILPCDSDRNMFIMMIIMLGLFHSQTSHHPIGYVVIILDFSYQLRTHRRRFNAKHQLKMVLFARNCFSSDLRTKRQ